VIGLAALNPSCKPLLRVLERMAAAAGVNFSIFSYEKETVEIT
jgi:hypothetical protein